MNADTRERRKTPRLDIELPLTLRVGFEERSLKALEVAQGGLFIATLNPPPLRQLVHLTLELPGERKLEVDGMVVRVVSQKDSPRVGSPPGIGVQFYGLDGVVEAMWRTFVDESTAEASQNLRDLVDRDDDNSEDFDEPSIEDIARSSGLDPRIVAAALASDTDTGFIEDKSRKSKVYDDLFDSLDERTSMEIDVLDSPPLVLIENEDGRRSDDGCPSRIPQSTPSEFEPVLITTPIQIIGPETNQGNPPLGSPSHPVTSSSASSVETSEQDDSDAEAPKTEAVDDDFGHDDFDDDDERATLVEPVDARSFIDDEAEQAQEEIEAAAGRKETLKLNPDQIRQFMKTDQRDSETKQHPSTTSQAIVPAASQGVVTVPKGADTRRQAMAQRNAPWSSSQTPLRPPRRQPRASAPLAPTGQLPHAVYRLGLPSVSALEDFAKTAFKAGGVFIRTDELRPIGTPSVVLVPHPESGDEFHIPGVIASIRAEGRAGVGIKFAGIDQFTVRDFRRFTALGTSEKADDWSTSSEGSGLSMVSRRNSPRDTRHQIPSDTKSIDLGKFEPFDGNRGRRR